MNTVRAIYRPCYLARKGVKGSQTESLPTLSSREYSWDRGKVREIKNPKIAFGTESSYRNDALASRLLDSNRLGVRSIEHGDAGRIHTIRL